MKIITIIGARPQFIKAAVVSHTFSSMPGNIHEVLIHTGQHYDSNMSKVFFDELNILAPSYNLAIGGGTHGQNTGRMIEKIEAVLLKERPDWVLVYGDTDSTLAGAIAAVKLHIPIAHVEAGLRSFNRRMPEELNRVLTDHTADLLFTPTDIASQNLMNEGISLRQIHQVGDVMYDAALFYAERAKEHSSILKQLDISSKSYVLATVHRAENTDNPIRLRSILDGFAASQTSIIWPLHPRTRDKISDYSLKLPDNILIIEPLGYLDMVMLERHASVIATDSGGVQKEAYFYGVPCVTLRDETEWVELVNCGMNSLVGTDSDKIANLLSIPSMPVEYTDSLYGDGKASQAIASALINY
ncbi:non-hydrolyzing UDP-N-acetylglucosamine 2-epimerase [Nitrincola alkalilacustris]|uniref:non-hydrolyzing UDP-N-acetylglucosamine 2-epimerase n=1 Tax=Nitrincola alkalilacustris TaxID=1571224 RepID=UPI00124E81E5|nr:UDP-N-acetylglucosamine 2-epimerase (non-hydrolyzing) [Nitrincola alkalilacustris]